MIDISALSVTAKEMRGLISREVGLPEDQVLIGHPMEAAGTGNADTTGKHYLNLFFYRVVYAGYPSDAGQDDPVYVRLHCLITALGANETVNNNVVTAGENDLRLIGSVMQILHATPTLAIRDAGGADIGLLQMVPVNLSLDDINHIWSTQGDTPYRLSVGYEIAMLPVPMAQRVEKAQRVGGVRTDVGLVDKPAAGIASDAGDASAVTFTRVDTTQEDWAPHICFVSEQDGQLQCSYSLGFEAASDALRLFVAKIWIAGDPDAEVFLYWERWLDGETGWQPHANKNGALIKRYAKPVGRDMDPARVASLPEDTFYKMFKPFYWGKAGSSQGMLYAVRRYTRSSDGAQIEVRSNPLLLIAGRREAP